jgi:hypothetical protein
MTNASSRRAPRLKIGGAIAAGVAIGAGLGLIGSSGARLPDPFSGDTARFPNDLANIDHWIQFSAEETQGRALPGRAAGALGSIISGITGSSVSGGHIFLPMTNNLSTDYHPTYSTPDLNMAAGAVLKPFDRAMYGNNDLGNDAQAGAALAGVGLAGLGAAISGGAGQNALNAIGRLGVTGDALGAALKVFGGIAQNPHKIVLFTGVDFRDHTFTWRLSPRNRDESDSIQQIIQMFTYYSHPEYVAGGLFFKYPEFFRIKFHHPEYLFELRPSVCTGIRVNYHTNGLPSYIRDADGTGIPAPSEVELSVSFKETEIITKQFLNKDRVFVTPKNNPIEAGGTVNPETGTLTSNLPAGSTFGLLL